MAQQKNWIGQKIGRLTVLEELEPYRSPSGKPTRRFRCRCECGSEVVQLQSQLADRRKQHQCPVCANANHAEKTTKEDLSGRRFGRLTVIGPAPLPQPQSNGQRNGWRCICDCGNEIITSRKALMGGKQSCGCLIGEAALHRINEDNILGRYDGTVLSAIRPERGANRNSKSGVKGVYWSSREQRWIAKITVRRKSITIGRFDCLKSAAKARRAAEEKYFGPILTKSNEEKIK